LRRTHLNIIVFFSEGLTTSRQHAVDGPVSRQYTSELSRRLHGESLNLTIEIVACSSSKRLILNADNLLMAARFDFAITQREINR